MATDSAHRAVSIDRVTAGKFTVTNDRGGRIDIGTGGDADFTPVELLLAAIGGVHLDRRGHPDVPAGGARGVPGAVGAEKVRDDHGNHLADIEVTFQVLFPPGEGGDAARALLPDAIRRSHDRLCTVSRTVELGIPVTSRVQAG